MFTLNSPFQPTGDQPQAIAKLEKGLHAGHKDQTLLGVTGSGKTFTISNVIEQTQKPTLLITHNKTLAAQLYQEMREFFPDSAVSYFVSYYDFYQPEAYVASSDTYIEKEAQINERIDKLRLVTTKNIMTRKDVIVVASVSAIYNIGDPREYGKFELPVSIGTEIAWQELARKLISMQYERSEYEFSRGTFRVRGNSLDIYPAYQDTAYRIEFGLTKISSITEFDPISGSSVSSKPKDLQNLVIYPAKHYLLDPARFKPAELEIRADLDREYKALKSAGKLIEAQRLLQRTNYDLESIRELGYVNGIENYSRYFDNREKGDRPYTLLDFFAHRYGDDWLTVLDESHMTIPQIRGMYRGDQARKKNLVDYGFRLNSALDNRPLRWEEFVLLAPHLIHVSATPNDWELDNSQQIVEQLVRPTGIVDPEIEIRPVKNEIADVIKEIQARAKKNERTLVTTLTKQTAEDLCGYLIEKGVRANYLHSDVKTLERTDILERLRKNEFDALIGVNLLREGLDLPEVTLVAILDADREGFLRSRVSLIQTMGRAARNVKGEVILYADRITDSMARAIDEIKRRREYQLEFNKEHSITPTTIKKAIRENVADLGDTEGLPWQTIDSQEHNKIINLDPHSLTPQDHAKWIKRLERDMKRLAKDMNFEAAIQVRDKLKELKK
mgnify:CR=1 FL=1